MSVRLVPRHRDERGVTIIIFALLMVAILVMVALVLDTSMIRQDRQSNKSAADFAVAAGVRGLEHTSGRPRPWKGACEALAYLTANNTEFSGLTGTWMTQTSTPTATLFGVTDPCANTGVAPYTLQCTPGTPATWAWFDGQTPDGRIDVDIKSGYVLPDPEFEASTTDPGDPAQGGCDQIAVIIRERQKTSFGGVADVDELSSRIRSVGRATIDTRLEAAVALLLLERHDCLALEVAGGGNEGEIIVKSAVGAAVGGIIAADSAADGSDCSTGNEVIEGKNKLSVPLIRAEPAPSCGLACTDPSRMGFITTFAKELGSSRDAFWANAAGQKIPPGAPPGARAQSHVWLCGTTATCDVGPTGGDRTTRAPADNRYLARLKAFRDAAQTAVFNAIDVPSTPVGYTAFSGGNCTVNTSVTVSAPKVYLDCATVRVQNGGTLTIDAPEVAFRGDIDVDNGGVLRIAQPAAVYVNGGTAAGVDIAGRFELANPGLGAACLPGNSPNVSKLLVRRGRLDVGSQGVMRLCNTFVHLAGGWKTGSTWNAGTIPDPLTQIGIAPYTSAMTGILSTSAGGSVDWSAPNTSPTTPTAAQLDNFEDLAFWSEASGSGAALHSIQGGGVMVLRGVFVIPNANPLSIGGNAGSTITADAQFFVRKMKNNGNVSFQMTANPADSIPTPFFKDFALVR